MATERFPSSRPRGRHNKPLENLPRKHAFLPKGKAPQVHVDEDAGQQREGLLRSIAEVERETGKRFPRKMAEVEGRRSAAIAACTAARHAGHDEIGRREYAVLRKIEALKRDEVWRGLDGLDGTI